MAKATEGKRAKLSEDKNCEIKSSTKLELGEELEEWLSKEKAVAENAEKKTAVKGGKGKNHPPHLTQH